MSSLDQNIAELRGRIRWAFGGDEWWRGRAASILQVLAEATPPDERLGDEIADDVVHISNDSGVDYMPWEATYFVHRGAAWLAWAITVASEGPKALKWQAEDRARDKLIAPDRMERIADIVAPDLGADGARRQAALRHLYWALAHHGRRGPKTWSCPAHLPDANALRGLDQPLTMLRDYASRLIDGRRRNVLRRWLDAVDSWRQARQANDAASAPALSPAVK